MNNSRRARLDEAIALIQRASGIIDGVCSDESDALDNLPDGLCDTERAEKMEQAIDSMNDAVDQLSSAEELLVAAKE